MGNTHPKSLYEALRAVALDITTRQVSSIAREHITIYGYACADYDVYRHQKPVSTAVTSKCYQGTITQYNALRTAYSHSYRCHLSSVTPVNDF